MFQLSITVDPSLGRLDYESLSDQALMEMLVDGLVEFHKRVFQDANEHFHDVCEWAGIECNDGRVEKVNLQERKVNKFTAKKFPFEFIPPLVVSFKAYKTNMHGTLDPADLPVNLKILRVYENSLHGSLSFKAFPRKMEDITIFKNNFHGSIQLSDFPSSLMQLDAENNSFCGEVCLNDLPPRMQWLQISANKLTGSINIERLPASIQVINLSKNEFSGEFRMLSIPRSLYRLNIQNNAFKETIVLAKASGNMHFALHADPVKSVLDQAGNVHKWQAHISRMQAQHG